MSMFKKVLSVVLCLSMLAGSFAMLGNLVPQASAAAGTSMVKSYDALEAEYDKFAAQYQMEKEEIKKVVPVEGLRGDLLNEKAIKFVRDNAKVTTARKPRAKKEEAA